VSTFAHGEAIGKPRSHRGCAALAVAIGVAIGALGGCAVGPPPGFSAGDRWVFPLVDPLDNDLLVTPVLIDGYGPYLFAIDPDATISAVDTQVVTETQARTGKGPRQVDETGAQQDRLYAELLNVRIGNLTIARRPAMVIPVGLYDANGRHFAGVLGRDVLDESLVFGFNRDQGIAMLSTEKAFRPPEHSVDFPYKAVSSKLPDLEVRPAPRRLARAQVNDELYSMHLDLGAKASQLRESHWGSAGLKAAPAKLTLVDEAATPRTVTEVGTANTVVLAAATRDGTAFVPYEDQRWETEGVDGALGLDFFAPFSVWMSWEHATCYLAARSNDVAATATARLGRWGSAVPACTHPGCVTAAVAAPDGSSAATGVTVTVTRDPEAAHRALQVVLAPIATPGSPSPGWLVANLTADADQATGQLGAAYAGVTLRVLDVSPFPRGCADQAAACVAPFAPTPSEAAAPPPGPPEPPRLPTVTGSRLQRRTGEPQIAPNDASRQAIAAAGTPVVAALVKVCLAADGTVESDKISRTSRVAVWDQQLLDDIKRTWTFDPVLIDGSPAGVCAPFVFTPQ